MDRVKSFIMAFALLALSQFVVAQVTTAQIREQIAKGECETAQSLYNVYKTMNGTNKTIEREIADCKNDSPDVLGGDLTFTVNGVSFVMKYVEGGTFWMGAQSENPNEPSYDYFASSSEKPVHSVTVSTFYMGETEVTQSLWIVVMGENPSYCRDNDLPVERVSWNDCLEFVHKLNQMTGENFRLPTEAEWEYAAHGGNLSKGYIYSGGNDIGKVAWYGNNSDMVTHTVKTKQPNELGLYDMSGNVWEWCSDWFDNYSESSQINPRGPSIGTHRVLRSSSLASSTGGCSITNRDFDIPDAKDSRYGLRLCLAK